MNLYKNSFSETISIFIVIYYVIVMLTKRIIPCLDCDLQVPEGRVVKGVEFKQIRYAGNPVELATKYYEDGADEIVICFL